MSAWTNVIITTAGKAAVAALVEAGQPVVFSKFALGNGTTGTPEELTGLVAWQTDVSITSCKATGGTVALSSTLTNMGCEEGYYVKEIGVFLRDIDGNNVLYGYLADSNPDYFPPEKMSVVDVPITITFVMTASADLTAQLDMAGYATLQDMEDFLNRIYPVGAIYLSVNSTNPATLFGGSWTQIQDCFLLAAGSTYSAGSIGGEANHTLTINEMPAHNHSSGSSGAHTHSEQSAGAHTHTAQSAGAHYHGAWGETDSNSAWPYGVYASGNSYYGSHSSDSNNNIYKTSTDGAHTHTTTSAGAHTHSISSVAAHTHSISSTGGNVAHNNMPPYIAVYMWQRIA